MLVITYVPFGIRLPPPLPLTVIVNVCVLLQPLVLV